MKQIPIYESQTHHLMTATAGRFIIHVGVPTYHKRCRCVCVHQPRNTRLGKKIVAAEVN